MVSDLRDAINKGWVGHGDFDARVAEDAVRAYFADQLRFLSRQGQPSVVRLDHVRALVRIGSYGEQGAALARYEASTPQGGEAHREAVPERPQGNAKPIGDTRGVA